ncbi:15895_t:CDS:2 [Dentiscutata erythropus]|uniref:15895_t:CDS:1 n=1 Tax=Dentiscutata erythropus TaxID=1348616 RepID=A0A9N9B8E5_9GLOM|nr:15895_t:CDS:2 [Dentiscutata erythropus]
MDGVEYLIAKSTKSNSTKSTSSAKHANINLFETNKLVEDHATSDTNEYITNLSETNKLTNNYTTFDTNKDATNLFETNGLIYDHTALDTDISELEDVEMDLENDFYDSNRQWDELNNKNNKYESQEFFIKLCIKDQDNITLPAKQLNILADSCGEFHYQILSHIQLQLNNTTITQNDYVLAYKITKETGAETQIINENDFRSFIEDYNQATIY